MELQSKMTWKLEAANWIFMMKTTFFQLLRCSGDFLSLPVAGQRAVALYEKRKCRVCSPKAFSRGEDARSSFETSSSR